MSAQEELLAPDTDPTDAAAAFEREKHGGVRFKSRHFLIKTPESDWAKQEEKGKRERPLGQVGISQQDSSGGERSQETPTCTAFSFMTCCCRE